MFMTFYTGGRGNGVLKSVKTTQVQLKLGKHNKNFTLRPTYFMLPSVTSMPRFSITSNTKTTNFKKIFVSVMNMLLIYLFASMKLEKGHKKLLGSSFKIMLPLYFMK